MFAILFSSPDVLLVNQTFNNLHFFTDMRCLEKPTLNSNVENAKIHNSIVSKNQNSQFLCLEKPKH